tara:strand:- start:202 stop:438 length:237 start_codon:yes stop_codon:yes gene_type:complete
MFVTNYENLNSSAINTLKVEETSVLITYNSNIDKEYEFSCQNTDKFSDKVSNTLKNSESIGKLINTSIKQGILVPVTK